MDELVRDGRERGREGERTKYEKINKFKIFFANVFHRCTTWHAALASDHVFEWRVWDLGWKYIYHDLMIQIDDLRVRRPR